MKNFFTRYRLYFLAAVIVLLSVYYFSLPSVLFSDPYSTVLTDREGELLTATIATDGQWRFPQLTTVPEKFEKAILTFEDKRFWYHPGVDVLSLGRAMQQNFRAGEIVSGGSTIDMQVMRLSRKGNARTFFEKIIEATLATRLQWRYSKKEILALYASHAPFGGNVVGLEAACWRYFARSPAELSWAEAAMLAVLPNAPSLIHPGKNREKLVKKRNQLLLQLKELNHIDEFTYRLAIQEQIPEAPHPLPMHAAHLLTRVAKDGKARTKVVTTISMALQKRVEQLLNDHYERLKGNEIHNACALVMEVETGNVLAYVGNVRTDKAHGKDVDIITSPRSTGSILKPILYAAMMDDGKLLPATMLPDVPTVINGFAPKNFSREYDGAVAANEALIRSLNIPAVHMLRDYRYERFYSLLKNMGMSTLHQPPDHYGLSLILGGAEGTLWDITGMYASMARTLNHYFNFPGANRYTKRDFHSPNYWRKDSTSAVHSEESVTPEAASWLSAASVYHTVEALKEVYRPGEESGWKLFSSSKKIAWKTGTSFGYRDGWAIGITSKYAVGVWVGNADGEGRPGLTGTETAAPILFDIFSQLPESSWFGIPLMEMREVKVCAVSGYLRSEFCETVSPKFIPASSAETKVCPYHQRVHLSSDLKYRVSSDCESVAAMNHVNWFVLPPVQEYYYKPKHLSYKTLPPWRSDCNPSAADNTMELVYPKPQAKIFIPRNLDGSLGASVFELAHRNPLAVAYWHLDGEFIGETKRIHQLSVNATEGKHVLTIVDDTGAILERKFQVISKM